MYFNVLTPRGIFSLATMSAGKNVSPKGFLGVNKQVIALFLYFFPQTRSSYFYMWKLNISNPGLTALLELCRPSKMVVLVTGSHLLSQCVNY